MKIVLVSPRYSISGVPLAQLRFGKALVKKGHRVDVIFGNIDKKYTMSVTGGVNIVNFRERKVRSMLFPIIRYLKENQPDVVFSAEDHLTVVVLIAAIFSRSRAKISGSSRVVPYDREAYSNKIMSKGWFFKKAMQLVMWRANALTCVSNDMVELYKEVFTSSQHVAVYNIIGNSESHELMREYVDDEWLLNKEYPVLITAGALARPKGGLDLINAVGLLIRKRKVRLLILGDGPLRNEMLSLIMDLGLNEYIKIKGFVDNPLKYFSRADVFILSSYAEGMPNVLVEAMMCGCTPVSTNCPTGPRELLQNGKYGYLIPMRDPVSMAIGIESALDNPIPENLLNEAVKPFSEEAVVRRHFKVLGLNVN